MSLSTMYIALFPSTLGRYELEVLWVAAVACATAIYAGVKRWRQQQLEARPSTPGQVEEVTVGKPAGFTFLPSNNRWEVVAHYSYSVDGELLRSAYNRQFDTEVAAWELAEALDEKAVQAYYRPDRPEKADLSELEIERLVEAFRLGQQATSRADEEPLFPGGRLWLYPVMAITGLGLCASVYVMIRSLMGDTFGPRIFVFHVLAILMFFPAVIIMISIQRTASSVKDVWKAIFVNVPAWAKYVSYLSFGAAIVLSSLSGIREKSHSPSPEMTGFASTWIAFYGISFLTAWAASRMKVTLLQRCPRGHDVPSGTRRCPTCNRPLWRLATNADRDSAVQPL